jgi:hypothetical protein
VLFDKLPNYIVKILLGYFSVKVWREDVFKVTAGNEILHEISTGDVVRVVACAISRNLLSRVQCSHITTLINTL